MAENCRLVWVVTPKLDMENGKFKPTGPGDEERIARQIEEKAAQVIENGTLDHQVAERKAVEKMASRVGRTYTCRDCGKGGFSCGPKVAKHRRTECPKYEKPKVILPQGDEKPTDPRKSRVNGHTEWVEKMAEELQAKRREILAKLIEENPELARIDAAIKALTGEGNPT
jgi:hypothetical protein